MRFYVTIEGSATKHPVGHIANQVLTVLLENNPNSILTVHPYPDQAFSDFKRNETRKYKIAIMDRFSGVISNCDALTRQAAVELVKTKLSAYMNPDDRIDWQRVPGETGKPRIAEILCSDGETTDIYAIIERS